MRIIEHRVFRTFKNPLSVRTRRTSTTGGSCKKKKLNYQLVGAWQKKKKFSFLHLLIYYIVSNRRAYINLHQRGLYVRQLMMTVGIALFRPSPRCGNMLFEFRNLRVSLEMSLCSIWNIHVQRTKKKKNNRFNNAIKCYCVKQRCSASPSFSCRPPNALKKFLVILKILFIKINTVSTFFHNANIRITRTRCTFHEFQLPVRSMRDT